MFLLENLYCCKSVFINIFATTKSYACQDKSKQYEQYLYNFKLQYCSYFFDLS